MLGMATQFPSVEQVRDGLNLLSSSELRTLADDSDVPLTTLLNIKQSDAPRGPTLETVRRFWPRLTKLIAQKKTAA
jgi:hypothetical protein